MLPAVRRWIDRWRRDVLAVVLLLLTVDTQALIARLDHLGIGLSICREAHHQLRNPERQLFIQVRMPRVPSLTVSVDELLHQLMFGTAECVSPPLQPVNVTAKAAVSVEATENFMALPARSKELARSTSRARLNPFRVPRPFKCSCTCAHRTASMAHPFSLATTFAAATLFASLAAFATPQPKAPLDPDQPPISRLGQICRLDMKSCLSLSKEPPRLCLTGTAPCLREGAPMQAGRLSAAPK
jgi:hypothetical protein